jgi:hypothetical protein
MTAQRLFASVLLVGTLALHGCRSTETEEEKPAAQEVIGTISEDDAKVRDVAEGFLDGIFKGLDTKDRKLFIENLTRDMREKTTETSFQSSCESFHERQGKYVSREFLCVMNEGPFRRILWKTKFSDNPNDVLTILILGKLDEEYKVFGFYFL